MSQIAHFAHLRLDLWRSKVWQYVYLNNYFNFHVCLSIRFRPFVCVSENQLHFLQSYHPENVTNKSCLVCVKSEKYTFLVTLRPLGSMRQDKANLRSLQYQAKQSHPSPYTQTHFRVSQPPQSRSKAVVCVSTPRMYPRSGYFLVF